MFHVDLEVERLKKNLRVRIVLSKKIDRVGFLAKQFFRLKIFENIENICISPAGTITTVLYSLEVLLFPLRYLHIGQTMCIV